MERRQYEEAAEVLDRFIRAHSRAEATPRALLLKGRCQSRFGRSADRTQALRTWEWLIRSFPQGDQAVLAYREMVDFHLKEGSPSLAGQVREQMLRAYPEHSATAEVWAREAESLMGQEKYAEALAAYRRVAAHLSGEDLRRMELCRALTDAGGNPERIVEVADRIFLEDPGQGIRLYGEYLKRAPTGGGAWRARTRLAYCYSRINEPGDLERAERLWREVVSRGPPDNEWVMESRWYLIQLLAGPRGQWRQAVAKTEEVIRAARPGTFRHEQAMFTRAWLHWANEDWGNALEGFQELVEHYPAKAGHGPIQAYLEEAAAKAR